MGLVLELVGQVRRRASGMRCDARSLAEERTAAVLAVLVEVGMTAGSLEARSCRVVVGSGRLAVEGMLLATARKEERIDAVAAMERFQEELASRG